MEMKENLDLKNRRCVPCEGGVGVLKGEGLEPFARLLSSHWRIEKEHHLVAEFLFPDFRQALDFTNRVGELAEDEGHHPDIHLAWGRVEIVVWTHAIDGLSENDFILAAKIDGVV